MTTPTDEPRLKYGDGPKPVVWHVLAMFACLLVMPFVSWAVEGDDAHPRVFVSAGLALVTLSLARWHYAHRGDERRGELYYYRWALVFLALFGAMGWMFSTSVLAAALVLVTVVDRGESDRR